MYRTNDLEGKVSLIQYYLIFRCTRAKLVKYKLEKQSSVIISSDPKLRNSRISLVNDFS